MLRRRSLWVVLAVLLTASLAVGAFAVQGFTGTRPLVVPSVESGALPLFDAADAAAASWHPDAALVALTATEGKPLEGRVDPPFLYDTSPDPVVGNGMAVAWTFAYFSPSEPGRMLFVTLGGDGSLLYQRALANPSYGCCYAVVAETSGHGDAQSVSSEAPPAPPVLLRPTLDAPDAFARVADRPEFAEFAADHPVFQAHLQLVHGPDNTPTWAIGYRTATYYWSSALVDARDGDVIEVFTWPQPTAPCCEPIGDVPPDPTPCCRPRDFHDTFEVTLGPSRPGHSVRVPVDSLPFAREMRIHVSVPQGLPVTDDVVIRLLDSEGRGLAYEKGQGDFEFVLKDFASQGIYTILLQLALPVRDVPVQVAADVFYGDEAAAPPASRTFRDATYAFGGQTYLPLWFQDMATTTRLTLRWDAPPGVDGMELTLLDSYGNEIDTVRADATPGVGGARELTLDVGPDEACCLTAVVRNGAYTTVEQPFELLVEVVPGEVYPYGPHPMH